MYIEIYMIPMMARVWKVSMRLLVMVHLHPWTCHLHAVACVCEGTVASHSNMDVMMPVAWPAAAESRLCLHWLLPSSLHWGSAVQEFSIKLGSNDTADQGGQYWGWHCACSLASLPSPVNRSSWNKQQNRVIKMYCTGVCELGCERVCVCRCVH